MHWYRRQKLNRYSNSYIVPTRPAHMQRTTAVAHTFLLPISLVVRGIISYFILLLDVRLLLVCVQAAGACSVWAVSR